MKNIKVNTKVIWIVVVLLSILKVAITFRIPVAIYCAEKSDDNLMFQYAESILDGHWLGTYNNLTLVKGISYPIFLVLCNLLMIPYSIGMALLNIAGATVFVKAIGKKLPNRNIRFVIYLLLIYSPVQFAYWISQRTYRMSLIPDMLLLIFGFMLGMFFRKEESIKTLIPWSIGAGVSLAFFWYIREDSIWIAPFVGAIIFLMILYFVFIQKERKKLIQKILITLIPIACVLLTTVGICVINHHYYGMYTTNDRSGTEFAKMMSNLYLIDDEKAPDDVWISDQMLEEAMQASPTLALAKNEIEKNMKAWEKDGPIPGDLVAWVLRNAVQEYGYYTDAISTNNYYHKVNQELQAAFANGTLKKDHSLHFSSQAAGISTDKIPALVHKTFVKIGELSVYNECGVKNTVSCNGGDEDDRTVEGMLQTFSTYSNKKNYDLSGWLFAKNDTDVLTADLVDNKNNVIFTLHFDDSPDVQAVYANKKNAAKSRFHVSLKDVTFKKVYLNVYVNGTLVSHAEPAGYDTNQIAGDMKGTLTVQKDNVVKYSRRAVDMANTIVKIYQRISPFMNLLAVIGYLIMTVTVMIDLIHKKYEHLDVWIGTTGVWLSAILLMFGVVFFCSWFTPERQHYLSFYAAGVYYLVQMTKYMAIVFGTQILIRFRRKNAS